MKRPECRLCGEAHWSHEAHKLPPEGGRGILPSRRKTPTVDRVYEVRAVATKPRTTPNETANTLETANRPGGDRGSPLRAECGHEVEKGKRGPKAKWCSDRCRMAFNRKRTKS